MSMVPAVPGSDWWDSSKYPERVSGQCFASVLSDGDLSAPRLYKGFLIRPRSQAYVAVSGDSIVKNEENEFRVTLDVRQFDVEDLSVKVVENSIEVHGKHNEKCDNYGFVSREFTRRYMLPRGCDNKAVSSSLTPDGKLIIVSPKLGIEESEKFEYTVNISGKQEVQRAEINNLESTKSAELINVSSCTRKILILDSPDRSSEKPKFANAASTTRKLILDSPNSSSEKPDVSNAASISGKLEVTDAASIPSLMEVKITNTGASIPLKRDVTDSSKSFSPGMAVVRATASSPEKAVTDDAEGFLSQTFSPAKEGAASKSPSPAKRIVDTVFRSGMPEIMATAGPKSTKANGSKSSTRNVSTAGSEQPKTVAMSGTKWLEFYDR